MSGGREGGRWEIEVWVGVVGEGDRVEGWGKAEDGKLGGGKKESRECEGREVGRKGAEGGRRVVGGVGEWDCRDGEVEKGGGWL